MTAAAWLWVVFGGVVVLLLVLDLGVFNRRARVVGFREAAAWSALWILLALAFNAGVLAVRGPDAALEFFTAYVVEKSLSVDNLFVFLLIFNSFAVPARVQHHVLFWGVLGALVIRAAFILAGVALMHHVHWIMYVFGAFLVMTAVRLLFGHAKEVHPEHNPVLRLFRRAVPITPSYHGDAFFIRRRGRLIATPLAVVLLIVESSDVVFAVDSIPAVLAISTDPLIVYTSNIFAIMGLRALYFLLAGVLQRLAGLHYGLAVILAFIGVKMIIAEWVEFPTWATLAFITVVLGVSVTASWRRPPAAQAVGH